MKAMEVFTRFVRQLSVILNCPANVVKAYLPDKFALSGKRSFNGQVQNHRWGGIGV
jgi:hypothetical protein